MNSSSRHQKSRSFLTTSTNAERLERRILLSSVVVNTVADQVDSAGSPTVSLRDAVSTANSSTTPTFITFDPIVFASTKTIVLGGTSLRLSNTAYATTITGPSAGVSVSGNHQSSIFGIAAGVSVTMTEVNIVDGNNQNVVNGVINGHGGGLNNSGTLLFENATVSGNVAGGAGGGGGFFNYGTIDVFNVTFSGNQAGGGGGGFEDYGPGTASLTDVTVCNNTTVPSPNTSPVGGGICGDCHTGYPTTISLTNVTVIDNSTSGAGGGIFLDPSNIGDTFSNVTVIGNTAGTNGGGIVYQSNGGVKIGNTIVAGNFVTGANSIGPDVKGTFTSVGHNLIGRTDGSSGWGSNDFTGTIATPLDPHLAPLAYSGGTTQTLLPLSGSPAIDHGSNALIPSGVTIDQRGLPRIANGTVDIGAVEVQPNMVLELVPVGGTFTLNNSTQNYSYTGTVNIGLTPVANSAFVPLLQETGGAVAYNFSNITASGTFTALQSNLGNFLFIGSFTVPDQSATVSQLSATAGVTLAGLATTFSGLTFTTGAGGTTNDSYLSLPGGFTLPVSLGTLQVSLPAANPFLVGTNGFNISSGKIPVPGGSFMIGGALTVSAQDMAFVYNSPNQELKIYGDFTATLKSGTNQLSLDLNFADPNYIDYEPQRTPELKVVGVMTYSNPSPTPLFSNLFSIANAQFSFDNATGGNLNVSGSVSVQTAGGTFNASIGFFNGALDAISLSGQQLNIPIGTTGLLLQTVGGGLKGLAPTDPANTQIYGTIGFSYGGIVQATFFTNIVLGPDNMLDDISGTVNLNIANGIAIGAATLDDNVAQETFGLTSLTIQAFNNKVNIQGMLVGSSGTLSGSLSGTIKLPTFFGIGGGTISGVVTTYLSSSSNPSLSYVSGSGQISGFGTVNIRYSFDGHISFSVTSVPVSGSLNNWTSQTDVANNDLDLVGGSLPTVTNQIAEGYSSGTWTGMGITSSAAMGDTSHLTALGVIQNNENGSPLFSASCPFDGTIPGASDILVKYTQYGDANLDGKVDGSDYSLIDNGYLNHLTGWYNGDFNYDGIVDGSDYTLIDNAFNQQGASLASRVAAPAARVDSTHPAAKLFSRLLIGEPVVASSTVVALANVAGSGVIASAADQVFGPAVTGQSFIAGDLLKGGKGSADAIAFVLK